MSLFIFALIYITGVIITSIILRIVNPELTTSTEVMCGTIIELKNENYEYAVLWPITLAFFILLSPVIISKYILDYNKN